MSFSRASTPSQPKLSKVDIPQAESMALNQDVKSYNLSDADWASRFPGFPVGRDFMIGDAQSQLGGAVSPQAQAALKTAGLAPEARAINTGSEFKTAQELGQPILAKEQRDRNFASNLFAQNPQRTFGLSGTDVVNIMEANTGNANAFRQAAFGTANNAFDAATAQSAQNIGALANVASGLVTDFSRFSNRSGGDPYTDPFSYVYSPPVSNLLGQSAPPSDTGVGYDLPGGGYSGDGG